VQWKCSSAGPPGDGRGVRLNLNVDGIITTNWGLFIEQIFPDYKPYIGQKELLFSNPQQIAEIYKIHGCCSGKPPIFKRDGFNRSAQHLGQFIGWRLKAKRFPWSSV
jgi:hypothetical protein